MKALIVSYFGSRDKPEVRENRKRYHQTQVEWLIDQGVKPSDIWVSSKDYDPEDYIDCLTYFDRPKRESILPPAVGRNDLLERWYETDDDWCMVLDNDAILDSRNKGNIIDWLDKNKLDGVDAFVPVNPQAPGKGAFNRLWEDSRIDDYWVFQRGEMKGTVMFIKNLNKHHYIKLYFDEGQRCQSAEDYFFGFDMARLGLVPMWCNNIVLKELATSKKDSMIWASDDVSRQEYQGLWKLAAVKEYDEIYMKGKMLMKSEFYDRHRVPKEVIVPKDPESENTLF